jgi:hypothetical protein
MFESSNERTVGNRKKIENIFYLVEIATPWTHEGTDGSALEIAYKKKAARYQPIIADFERKKPGHKCIQATIIVSPTGAFYRESQEEFAKVPKLARGKLAIRKRCIVDAAIQGAYEQWRQFGRKLVLATQLEALNPGAWPRLNFMDAEASEEMGRLILEECPEASVEVSVQTREDGPNQVIAPDVCTVSPIELYEASVSETRARLFQGLPPLPIERHPDGHKEDPDDGHDAQFGKRAALDQRVLRAPKGRVEPRTFPPFLPVDPVDPNIETVTVECGYDGVWSDHTISRTIQEEEFNALISAYLGPPVATPDFTAVSFLSGRFTWTPDLDHAQASPEMFPPHYDHACLA